MLTPTVSIQLRAIVLSDLASHNQATSQKCNLPIHPSITIDYVKILYPYITDEDLRVL